MAEVLDRLAADGLDKNQTITVTFFRHRNKHDNGKRYVWNLAKEFKTFQQFQMKLAADISGPTGRVRAAYDAQGNEITSLDQLEHNGMYVCCGSEAFTAAGVPPKMAGEDYQYEAPEGRVAETEALTDQAIAQNKTLVCYFYGAAGQCKKTDKGHRLVVNRSRYKNINQLLKDVKVRLIIGSVQRIYDLEGNIIEKVDDLTDEGKYICSILKPWSVKMIPGSVDKPCA